MHTRTPVARATAGDRGTAGRPSAPVPGRLCRRAEVASERGRRPSAPPSPCRRHGRPAQCRAMHGPGAGTQGPRSKASRETCSPHKLEM